MIDPEQKKTSIGLKSDTPTVLMVDDDVNILSALKRTFRNEPYRVLATEDPIQALEWIRTQSVDLVIADEFMPAMQGTELLEAARRFAPKSSSIVLTGYPNTTVTSRAHQQRVDLMITKPWEDEVLRKSVRLLLCDREGSRRAGTSPKRIPKGAASGTGGEVDHAR